MQEATERHRAREQQGFTIIELMVVILIVAILVAIAVPVYNSLQGRADKAVAEYNIKAAEEIHTHIWFALIEKSAFPVAGECYVDVASPVDAQYFSSRETKIDWVDITASGSLIADNSSGMIASLAPSSPLLATLPPGFQFGIRGYYRGGTMTRAGDDNHIMNMVGKIAVVYDQYYLDGTWFANTDHKYISLMVVEKAGTLHITTFLQGRSVGSEDFVWDEPDVVNFPPGPPELGDTLAVNPGTLNIASMGDFNTSFDIELTVYEGFNVNSFNVGTITCGGAHAVDVKMTENGKVIIKFDRQDLVTDQTGNAIPITIAGQYTNGDSFSGTTTVKVISR